MKEVKVGSHTYRIEKIPNTFTQMQISRRLLPLALGCADIAALFNGVSKMDDETFKYISFGLLENVQRKEKSGTYSAITTDNELMYADINMVDFILLLKESAEVNFGFLGSEFARILQGLKIAPTTSS